MPSVTPPYLLFLGDVSDALAAKLARGVLDWRSEWCLGQQRLPGCAVDLGLAEMTSEEAVTAGAKTFVVGAVNAGGVLPANWVASIVGALDAGLDVAAGMHVRLRSVPEIAEAAARNGRALHDLRHPPAGLPVGKGHKRTGKRLLAVGTDCSVGKKYAALCLERDMRSAGFDADFRATGQTGVLIAGRGLAIDAVVADFIAGAAEWLTPDADEAHWDVIEGQGSLFHPSFAGVTLGLLHGSQPDAFVVCHEPTRTTMRGVAHPLPSLADVIDTTLRLGRLTNPAIRCVGLCVNTAALDEAEARKLLVDLAADHALPATDPLRFGSGAIVREIASRFGGPVHKGADS